MRSGAEWLMRKPIPIFTYDNKKTNKATDLRLHTILNDYNQSRLCQQGYQKFLEAFPTPKWFIGLDKSLLDNNKPLLES